MNQSDWFKLDEESKTAIKNALLSELGNEESKTVKDIGLCISAIAAVEVPVG